MLKDQSGKVYHWVRTAITEPRSELTRWESAVRYAYDLGIHGYRALRRDNAPQMASALAFRTLFALLPIVVVSSILIKALRGDEPFKRLVSGVIEAFGLNELSISAGAVDAAGNDVGQTLGSWLEGLISTLAQTDFSALGWVGVAVIVYSAIWTMVAIENSFNAIYGAPEGRPWVQRFVLYWTVLTLGPAFIGLTIFVDARFSAIIEGVATWGWLLTLAKSLWGFTVAWLLMCMIYRLVPNTAVQMRAALVGALVAAVLLQVGKGTLGSYFSHAVSFRSLYGTLGLVPVFMFWVYLMWLVVLFGLEVSATIQSLQGRAFEKVQEKQPSSGLVDPMQVVTVMEIVTERFAKGLPTSLREITDQTRVPELLVSRIVDRLARAGVVHRVEGGENGITLALPPEQISGDRLVEIGFGLVDEGGTGRVSPLISRLREMQRRMAGETTLAAMVPVAAISADQAPAP